MNADYETASTIGCLVVMGLLSLLFTPTNSRALPTAEQQAAAWAEQQRRLAEYNEECAKINAENARETARWKEMERATGRMLPAPVRRDYPRLPL